MKIEFKNKTFQLINNGQILASLTYKRLFSNKAEIKTSESEYYTISSTGFLGTSMTVSKNKSAYATMRLNWKGQFIILFTNGDEYIISATGIGWFRIRYVLRNKKQEELIQFDPQFNWRKFGYDFDIKINKGEYDLLLVMLGVFASNYHLAYIMA